MSNEQNQEIMKTYTAIYDTKTIKGIQYSFKAENMESAINYGNQKFDHENISNFKIIED